MPNNTVCNECLGRSCGSKAMANCTANIEEDKERGGIYYLDIPAADIDIDNVNFTIERNPNTLMSTNQSKLDALSYIPSTHDLAYSLRSLSTILETSNPVYLLGVKPTLYLYIKSFMIDISSIHDTDVNAKTAASVMFNQLRKLFSTTGNIDMNYSTGDVALHVEFEHFKLSIIADKDEVCNKENVTNTYSTYKYTLPEIGE